MKKITAIILICTILTGVLGITASAVSYEEYMRQYGASSKSSKAGSTYKYYDFIFADQYKNQRIPAIMYHKITNNPAEVTDYVITKDMLIADFNEIRARGYTPIFVSEYYDLVNTYNMSGKDKYSKINEFFENNRKPIIITFDDGYEGIYKDALPIMKQYGFKVNFYICGQLIEDKNPEYCSWEQLKELNDSGLAEIGNHTYGLHKHNKEALRELYNYDLYGAIQDINYNRSLIREKIGVDSTTFSFPYGLYNDYVVNTLKAQGYTAFISTDYRVNSLADKQIALGRFNRPASFTTRDFFNLIEKY